MSDDALPPPRHEAQDIGPRFALAAVGVVGATLAVMIALATWLYPGTIGARFVPAHLPREAAPALQSSPRYDMATFRAQELARLNSAGWTDAAAGRVHIPIADAMRLIAGRGIPGWPAPR